VKTNQTPYSYDLIPYESHSYPQSHPDHLATLGSLFGLTPPPVTRCRVLELGCASGGNLIPMAYHLPESEFVGVDLSKREVEMGRKTVQDLGLKNIRIKHANITDVDGSFGVFDYIIAHGVYSWVPDAVQDKIFAISGENLAPNGIAYISYNTYPGWHIREMIRHMMLYHTNQFKETKERIEQARALMDFLASSVPTGTDYFGLLLKSELDLIRRAEDWYIFHDHLEENNSPVYFHQFIEQAEKHGLQYLAEAQFSKMLASGFSREVEKTLEGISKDTVEAEQYMDFLRNRLFRQTLLCHMNLSFKRTLVADNLEGILIASRADTAGEPIDLSPGVKQVFKAPNGAKIKTDFPLTKAALVVLRRAWPEAMNLSTLIKKSKQFLQKKLNHYEMAAIEERETLGEDLLYCFAGNAIEFHTWQADFVTAVSERPMVSPLAAYQARHGLPIVNQRHEVINFDPISKELLKVMDGHKNHKAILDHLVKRAADGTFVLEENDKQISGKNHLRDALKTSMEEIVRNLAKSALLLK
jgi:methyltransferase-like protein/SAM-dependent methyltransferase